MTANMSLQCASLTFTTPPTTFSPSSTLTKQHRIFKTHFPFTFTLSTTTSPPIRPPCLISSSAAAAKLRAVPASLLNDAGAAALVTAGAYGFVRTCDELTDRNLIQQFKQKSGAHFVWLAVHVFLANFQNSNSMEARYFAALVPFLNCLRLIIYGLQLIEDKGLVKSVSREGNPRELLRGPLYYVLILILCSILFWRESPIGMISLAMMCGGDGFADIMGRRFGSIKIPYNQQKSLVGSLSMFLFGFLISIGMLYYFSALGYFYLDWALTVERVALVSLVATLVESLPITDIVDDNISVPLSSMVMAFMFFGGKTPH
ncbi:hypothetical protein Sjap_013611 [Stephania japonica]|uniref:phytol kinase n=1 Tax=Stephania japonica TaxID=461633 RepID=A0AAP0IY75_9MAGN